MEKETGSKESKDADDFTAKKKPEKALKKNKGKERRTGS